MKKEIIDIREIFSMAAKHALKDRGLKQNALAKKIGMSISALNNYVNGRREGDEGTRRKIAQALGYSYESMLSLGQWILDGNDPADWRPASIHAGIAVSCNMEGEVESGYEVAGEEFVAVPKYKAKLSGGHGSLIDSDLVETNLMFRNEFLARRGDPKRMALFEVMGDSMEPFIYDGDVVLVDMSQREIIDGKAYAFREDHTVKIKRLSTQGNVIIATSENSMRYPAYAVETDNFDLIGRVIWVGHEVR